jgi:hypothetical protein
MLGEFVLRAALALLLPTGAALAASSAAMMSVGLGLGAWNLAYGLRLLLLLRRQQLTPPETTVSTGEPVG